MTTHLSEETVARFGTGTLGPAELAELDGHLEACGRCRERLAAARPATDSGVLASVRGESRRHLAFEEIEGLVDGVLDAHTRQACEDHTALCGLCAREIEDFRSFAARLAEPVATSDRSTADAEPVAGAWMALRRWTGQHRGGLALVGGVLIVVLAIQLAPRQGSSPMRSSASLQSGALGAALPATIVEMAPERAARIERLLIGEPWDREMSLPGVASGAPDSLVSPVGEAVDELEPVLTWRAGRETYRIEVIKGDAVVVAADVTATPDDGVARWRTTSALAPGTVYTWRVTGPGIAGHTAAFRTLTLDEIALWQALANRLSEQPLLVGATAQDFGLVSTALDFYGVAQDLKRGSEPAAQLARRLHDSRTR